jgi:hypothetical protein
MQMEMPKVTDEHRKLGAFVGTWRGEETLSPSPWDPKGGTATADWTAEFGCDGFFLLTHYAQSRGGRVTYRGHGVYGWDVHEKCYSMHWFDSMGDGGLQAGIKGTWEGNVLTYAHQTPRGHHRYVYTVENPDRYLFEIQYSPDGATWSSFIKGVYTRVK